MSFLHRKCCFLIQLHLNVSRLSVCSSSSSFFFGFFCNLSSNHQLLNHFCNLSSNHQLLNQSVEVNIYWFCFETELGWEHFCKTCVNRQNGINISPLSSRVRRRARRRYEDTSAVRKRSSGSVAVAAVTVKIEPRGNTNAPCSSGMNHF